MFVYIRSQFLAFTPRCIITATAFSINAETFLRKNCRFVLFSPRCFVIPPRCIITATAFSINAEAFLQKNCLFLFFSPRCIFFSPRCFRQKWAIIDNFCQFNRIFWLYLSPVWAQTFVVCLLLFLLCPTISKTKGFLFFLCPCLA